MEKEMYSLLSQLVQKELDKRQEEVKMIQDLLKKDLKIEQLRIV